MFFNDNSTDKAFVTLFMFFFMMPLLQVQFPNAQYLFLTLYFGVFLFVLYKLSGK